MNCQVRTTLPSLRLSLQITGLKHPREVVMSEEEVDDEDNGHRSVIRNFVETGVETDLKQVVVVEENEMKNEVKNTDGDYSAVTVDSDVVSATSVVADGGGSDDTADGSSNTSGHLTPDLQRVSPPSFPKKLEDEKKKKEIQFPSIVGRYILLGRQDEKPLFICVNIDNERQYTCKIVDNKNQQAKALYYRVDSHECLNELVEVLVGVEQTYLFFNRSYGDLHTYVRNRRRLKETEAVKLFRQVVQAVQHCHNNGIVLRDLKLRKFVFKDPQRTQLKLESLDDAVSVGCDNDILDDKHGCPAYVSPEILTIGGYSGKAADVWSLGVVLYAMLVGRYPFHDTEHNTLFTKIRGGHYIIPDTISSKAKCLIRCLLRHNPSERLTADDILRHPWFHSSGVSGRVLETRPNIINSSNTAVTSTQTSIATTTTTTGGNKFGDQMVPDCGIFLFPNNPLAGSKY